MWQKILKAMDYLCIEPIGNYKYGDIISQETYDALDKIQQDAFTNIGDGQEYEDDE